MIRTHPLGHCRIALSVDGHVVFIGTAQQIRNLIGV
jgi:hypothetical protein